jgi:hypothetical protein
MKDQRVHPECLGASGCLIARERIRPVLDQLRDELEFAEFSVTNARRRLHDLSAELQELGCGLYRDDDAVQKPSSSALQSGQDPSHSMGLSANSSALSSGVKPERR